MKSKDPINSKLPPQGVSRAELKEWAYRRYQAIIDQKHDAYKPICGVCGKKGRLFVQLDDIDDYDQIQDHNDIWAIASMLFVCDHCGAEWEKRLEGEPQADG